MSVLKTKPVDYTGLLNNSRKQRITEYGLKSINNIYFPSNNAKLQCRKCYGTRKATRKALRSLKLVA